MVCNTNASMVSKLAKFKARPDGELMRLIEFHIKRIVIPYGDEIFAKLRENYGVAGPIYAQWFVKNKDKLQRLIDKKRTTLWKKIGKRIEERFIVGLAAVILVGGRLAQELGLHDLDMDHLEDWFVQEHLESREVIENEISDAQGLLGDFLNENANFIVGVNKNEIDPFTRSYVFHQPKGKVVARFEILGDTGSMYISKKVFRDYCVNRQFTMAAALDDASKPNSPYRYIGAAKKRLQSDTGILVPAVDALMFQCDDDETSAFKQALKEKAELDAQVES